MLRSSLAKEHGLDVSYLERLCSLPLYSRDLEKFREYGGYDPLLITKLVDNYRCHPAIIGLSSCMFYDDELKVKVIETSLLSTIGVVNVRMSLELRLDEDD